MSEPNTFTCAQCGWTGESGWTDDEAMAEAESNGFLGDGADNVVVCDDCYAQIMAFNLPGWEPTSTRPTT